MTESSAQASELLRVQDLHVHFPARTRLFGNAPSVVRAVDGVSFSVGEAETVGLVGESGCGKSTLGRAIIRLIEPASGGLFFRGQNMLAWGKRELRAQRRNFQMIFQDPYSSLDPKMRVRDILAEPLEIHHLAVASRQQRIEELLEGVGLHAAHAGRKPHEFSGGQRQRIGIARALAVQPSFIVCDEPVSALDVSVQAQIVNLLGAVQKTEKIALLFIAHDLAVVEHISRRILVMYLGRIVESGLARQVCGNPKHPYTQALIEAIPEVRGVSKKRTQLKGDPPSALAAPAGCAFHPRCPRAEERCRVERPLLREVGDGQAAACHFP